MPQTYEQQYIGSALIRPETLTEYPIDNADLNDYQFRAIHRVMCDGVTDPLLVAEKANVDYADIVTLMAGVISAYNADQHQREIIRAAQARAVLGILSEGVNDIHSGDFDAVQIANRLIKTVRVMGETTSIEDVAAGYEAYIEQREQDPSDVWGIAAPWANFNKVTGGLHKKESVLIFGPSGIGKTVAVLQMGYHAACHGYKVAFYELEMSAANLFGRMVAMRSRVPTDLIHKGKMSVQERSKVRQAIDYVKSLPITISDETHWTSSQIRADQQKNPADVVIVDYLALLQDKAENAYERVEYAAKNLRQMAKDLNQCVLTVSSEVKDGSIKGTAEVKFSQDMVWRIEKVSDDENDMVRYLRPNKLRNSGVFAEVRMKMVDNLPMLEQW